MILCLLHFKVYYSTKKQSIHTHVIHLLPSEMFHDLLIDFTAFHLQQSRLFLLEPLFFDFLLRDEFTDLPPLERHQTFSRLAFLGPCR